jgi:multicomponent Na+:H+ antiporter subunit A
MLGSLPDFGVVAIVLSPFLALPVAGWLGSGGKRAYLLALIPAALAGYFTYAFWLIETSGAFTATVPWATGLNLSLSFHLDGLGLLFATLITSVGALIVVYAVKYLEGHPHAGRFQISLFAFMGSMLGLVLSDNVILLFVFWELTGFTSYLLIGFEHERQDARRAALQALLVTGGGGLALLAAAILLARVGGTASLSELITRGSLAGDDTYPGIVCLILLAAFTKSAQFPFHFWLPNAMQAPTPVSAYLHSATMVKAGIYLVARTTPFLGNTSLWTISIAAVATLTMIVGSWRALLETDLKRVLAYSTIAALGVLMLLFGAGTAIAATAGIVYLIAHACYKGALFLVTGAVEHETGTRDVTALGGLNATMRATSVAAALAALSMLGIPLFFGFIAKEQFYESVTTFGVADAWRNIILGAAVAGSACLGAAGLIAGIAPFRGAATAARAPHDAPRSLVIGPLVLGIAGLIFGVAPSLLASPVRLAVGAVTRTDPAVNLALWHGLTPTLLLSVLTLGGAIALYRSRHLLWRFSWPRALRIERLYSGTLSGLDALSRWMAPALQSASLRSYVITVLITAIALQVAALATGRVLPTPRRWTPIEWYEGVVAMLIVAGAITAAVATSNMAAVLSLGAVGYGVALMYALLGAPDLAMTQFAVETLTVVIFVLVFSQLRGFRDLSSRLVRTRDAIVAAAVGTLVTTLVLYIGASGTTSRLSSYFAEAAPSLAHGRNVVNVILVDFRGFDTLGETTVLVTVAIGVRALLLIGKERRR